MADTKNLSDWIGREEIVEEVIPAAPIRMLAATLDNAAQPPRAGDPVPPLAHWTFLIPTHLQSELAEDGHGLRGNFMPPVTLPRRMFAGARISFLRPLRVNQNARRRGVIEDIKAKRGRSGDLVFVKIRQKIAVEGELALVEEQDIVYREAPRPGAPQAALCPPPRAPEHSRTYYPDEAMLFRYSALIFNAHRIHFDRPYTENQEGYPGLVVHGQLVATCLADLAMREWNADLATFSFRAVAPLFSGRPFNVHGARNGEGVDLWATDAEGNLAMSAEASFTRHAPTSE